MNTHLPHLRVHSEGLHHLGFEEESQNIELLPKQQINQLPSKSMYVFVPIGCKTLNKLLLALWILKLLILQCLCIIRYWFGNMVNGEQRRCFILMIGIWNDCRGCIKTIIPNFWFYCLERVLWIHFCKLFWSSSSGSCASRWRSSNLFTLSCLGMIIFSCTFPLSSMCLCTSTSCHSGNNLLCKETIQCRSLAMMQQPSP